MITLNSEILHAVYPVQAELVSFDVINYFMYSSWQWTLASFPGWEWG